MKLGQCEVMRGRLEVLDTSCKPEHSQGTSEAQEVKQR